MRGFSVLTTLALGIASGVGIQAREVESRALVDVCANVNADLKLVNLLGIKLTVGHLDVCLCLSALPLFLKTNIIAEAASTLFGETAVTAAITALINGASDHQTCNYPDHSVPLCVSGDACGFSCKDGFTKEGKQCVCAAPKTVCNGVCGTGACPSAGARKRDVHYWAKTAQCPPQLTACGVFGGSSRAWECVDTQNDLESCGGCTLEINPLMPGHGGVDCTSLHAVSDVSCMKGECVIHRCMSGYEPSMTETGAECVKSETVGTKFAKAANFGLEHVPFWKD